MIGVELFLEQFSGKSKFCSARTDGNNTKMLVKIKHKIILFNIPTNSNIPNHLLNLTIHKYQIIVNVIKKCIILDMKISLKL